MPFHNEVKKVDKNMPGHKIILYRRLSIDFNESNQREINASI